VGLRDHAALEVVFSPDAFDQPSDESMKVH
jgi:hypothetical protein